MIIVATFPFSNLIEGIKKIWTVPTGADADNAAVTKNPVLIGGRFSTTPATRHDGDVATLETDSTGILLTKLSGSKMDLRGTAATKPLASAVTIGTTYWSVDTDPQGYAIEVSNGTSWVVI